VKLAMIVDALRSEFTDFLLLRRLSLKVLRRQTWSK